MLADHAPPLSVSRVKAIIAAARPGARPNLAGLRLAGFDLTGVNFRRANLASANLFEATLIAANLAGTTMDHANFSGVKMDHARAQHASLRGAMLLTTASGANFEAADLSRVSGYLIAPGSNLRDAVLAHARLGSDLSNQPMGLLHTIFSHADLAGADLSFADLSFADLGYASFRRAIVRAVNFRGADLSGADFSRADVTNANFANADLAGTIFIGVRGRSSMKGLGNARNLDQAIFRR